MEAKRKVKLIFVREDIYEKFKVKLKSKNKEISKTLEQYMEKVVR